MKTNLTPRTRGSLRSLHELGALILVGAAVSAVAAIPACGTGGGSLAGPCSSVCDKQEACGDIDSVKAEQCRKKCDADADVLAAALDACINKDDILSATSQCLARACSDYASCLTTIPACKGGGTTGTGTGTGTSLTCDETTNGVHICLTFESSSANACPAGSTEVSACSTIDRIGTCTVTQNGNTAVESVYLGGGVTEASAQTACANSKGTWSPG